MDLLVAADDRTGALETAGALAHAGAGLVPTLTSVGETACTVAAVVVVDVATRHVAADRAATIASAVDGVAAARHAHKFDSTLRGNWAGELVGRHAASGRPVLVVPSFPGLGRTCVGGVVLDHGTPVHKGPAGVDARAPVTHSWPAEMLRTAGAIEVVGCHELSDVVDWLELPGGFAVADAASDADLLAIANRWVGVDGVLLAGTSAVIGAAGARLFERDGPDAPPAVVGMILVVCGSAHPTAHEQVERAAARGALVVREAYESAADLADGTSPVVLVQPATGGRAADAAGALPALGRAASSIMSRHRVGALVVIGGDTAEAVLGPGRLDVGGVVVEGTPWARRPGGDGPLIVTRAGGFGGPDALVDLLWGTLAR